MVEAVPIIIFVVILVVIIFVISSLLGFIGSSKNRGGAASSGNNTAATGRNINPQYPAAFANRSVGKVYFYNVNVQYVYSGPSMKGNRSCSYRTYTFVDGQSLYINGSTIFALKFQPVSTQCPLTIESMSVDTPGFALLSSEPSLPIDLPPNSQIQLQFNIVAPSSNYNGPLTITISDQ